MKMYNKLVRDRIPEIIAADGRGCSVRKLNRDEYEQALVEKLREEVLEFEVDRSVEELADIAEILVALASCYGVSAQELEDLRTKKTQLRGGFEQRLFLEYVND